MTSSATFRYRRPLRFSETDAAGVVHFSRLLAIVEEAEHAWFQELGIPVFGGGPVWPRVRLEVDFRAPCRFGEILEIGLAIVKLGRSSIEIRFTGSTETGGRAGVVVVTGSVVICHAIQQPGGGFSAAPLPSGLRQALVPAD